MEKVRLSGFEHDIMENSLDGDGDDDAEPCRSTLFSLDGMKVSEVWIFIVKRTREAKEMGSRRKSASFHHSK